MFTLACESEIQFSNGNPVCTTGWIAIENGEGLQNLIKLFEFDFVVFAGLMATCVVIFISAYAAGHVLRLFGRV